MISCSMQIDKSIFGQNWKKFLFWGIAFVLLGMVAASAAVFTTLLTVIFIGFIILIAGAIIMVDAVTFWRGKMSGLLLHLVMGLLYVVVGMMLIQSPFKASISLTLLLGIFYLALGVFRTVYALSHRMPRWGLNLFHALVTLALGALILANWPASSLYIIGLFVGIDLIFCGYVYIMGALAGHAMQK